MIALNFHGWHDAPWLEVVDGDGKLCAYQMYARESRKGVEWVEKWWKSGVDNIRADLWMFSTSRGSTLSLHLSAIWLRQVPARMWLHRLKHRCLRIKQRAGRAPRCWSGAGVKRWGIKISMGKKKTKKTTEDKSQCEQCVIVCQRAATGNTMGLGL